MAVRYLVLFSTILLFSGCKGKPPATTEDPAQAKQSSRYVNPVIPGDFADPSVILVEGTYYAVGTSSEWAPHLPIFTSTDLVNWEQQSYALTQSPSWAVSSFWAPELYFHNDLFYVYYVAKRKSDGVSYIGVATSKNPENGFTDRGIILAHGSEAIDPFVLNDDGQLYLSWKAYGLDDRPIEILAAKLSDDGLEVEGEAFSLLEDTNARGIEGQYIVKKDDYFYLFYSEGACCGSECDYDIRVARALDFEGPYKRYQQNPILEGNEEWKCPGHGTMVKSEDQRWFYMYHAYSGEDDIYTGKQGLLDEIQWNDSGWPSFVQGSHPTSQAVLAGENIPSETTGSMEDDFDASSLSYSWQWDFRNADPQIELKGENLSLTGKIHADNKSGTALTVRPYSGFYEITTEVIRENHALKGLTLYGDVNQSVGIGVKNNNIQLWEVKDNTRRVLTEKTIDELAPLQLKMKVEEGYKITFFYRNASSSNWMEMKFGQEGDFYDGRHLPQWDRSPRPGLLHFGPVEAPAVFSHFKINYTTNRHH